MEAKVPFTYEIYGSPAASRNGYWRWQIISSASKKVLQVGSIYGPFVGAQEQAQAALERASADIQPDNKK
jgi:hypothetical protein